MPRMLNSVSFPIVVSSLPTIKLGFEMLALKCWDFIKLVGNPFPHLHEHCYCLNFQLNGSSKENRLYGFSASVY